MKTNSVVLLLSPLLILLSGCEQPKAPPPPEKVTAPASTSSIVIDVGEQLTVLHEAQPGQMLEWKPISPKTPNFWIQFIGSSPCASGALVLSGNATHTASCVAGLKAGASGTITYSYLIRASSPPLVLPSDPTSDVFGRCVGCNN